MGVTMGGPTAALLRMVGSMETRAQRMAVLRRVPGRMIRSRIGLPYSFSPICRKGVRHEA